MTPEEKRIRELELELELAEAEEAAAQTAIEEPSKSEAFLRGAGRGVTFGLGNNVNGFIQALGAKLFQDEKRPFWDSYRQNRDTFNREDARAEAAHRGHFIGGNVLGGLMTAPLLPGAGQGATLAQLAGHGAKVGAATGAAYGFGTSQGDLTRGEFGQVAGDTTLGALLGGGLGAGAPVLASGAGWTARNVGAPMMSYLRGGYITPTQEAGRLMQRGVPLTLGRMDPSSAFGRIEELAANKVTGGSVAAARQRTEAGARDALIEAAGEGVPGMGRTPTSIPAAGARDIGALGTAAGPTRGAPVAQQLEELRAGFSQAYDQALEGARLQPDQYLGRGRWRGLLTDPALKGSAKTKGAFELAASARDIDASPAVRARALAWLTDKAQTLAPTKSGSSAGTVDARQIHALRTQLRDKLRSLGQEGDDRQLREIYGRAEEFVTELLEGQLPAENATMLRAADTHYRNLLAVEKASDGARAFRNNHEFTPDEVLNQIRKSGGTPDFEAAARDAHSVLTARYPMTGIQVAANESIPLLNKAGPAWAAFANASPTMTRHALHPWFSPGLPARTAGAAGRWAERTGGDPRANSLTARSLYELLTQPQDGAPPWGVSE